MSSNSSDSSNNLEVHENIRLKLSSLPSEILTNDQNRVLSIVKKKVNCILERDLWYLISGIDEYSRLTSGYNLSNNSKVNSMKKDCRIRIRQALGLLKTKYSSLFFECT